MDMRTLSMTTRRLRTNAARGSARGGRDASALVEMAIAMPLLCLLTLGLIEYGWVFLRVSQINMAARHGVRVAVRPDATEQNVTDAVAMMMNSSGMKDSGYTMTHTNLAVGVGEAVTVHISVDYKKLTLTNTSLVPLPGAIQGRGTMAKEGPPAT
jgi:Flp pilus assembly protein TadG